MFRSALLTVSVAICAAAFKPWMEPGQTPADRAQKLLAEMTLEEKVVMLHGSPTPYVGGVNANDRLGIPALTLNDGPQGFRTDKGAVPGTSTAWPCGLAIGASWDPSLAREWGAAQGREFAGKGSNVQLGPGMCLARVPYCGRNFEYVSGEDPFLGAGVVGHVITGIQSAGVIANAKHWVNNNQETNRGDVNAIVDDRTRWEIYYPPFQAAIDADVGSFMCSYNKVNGFWSCENNDTLATDLKARMGFKGWVMSDWGATHSTSIVEGLDQQMPDDSFFGQTLIDSVNAGAIPQSAVDDSVLRVLTPMFTVGLFDKGSPPAAGSLSNNVSNAAHTALARSIAANTTILLQNVNNILPLSKKLKSIALIGTEVIKPTVSGGGSGSVVPAYLSNLAHAMYNTIGTKRAPSNCSFEENTDYLQPNVDPIGLAANASECCAMCAATVGCNAFTYANSGKSRWSCWGKPNTVGRVSSEGLISGLCAPSKISYANGKDAAAATQAAADADYAIVVVGTFSTEGSDRTTLGLASTDDDLIRLVARANPNTIVIVNTVGAVLMPWASEVAAILLAFMPGQEAGNAMTDLLFGDVNPSAKLPITMPNVENETGFTRYEWPGVNLNATYSEGLFIGYRWYDQHKVIPRFPFGHGLSYATFEYSNLITSSESIQVDVTNTATVAGAEVVQLYLGFPESAGEPPKQLKGFQKIYLLNGQKSTVTFSLTDRDKSIYDITKADFAVVKGQFDVYVGSSSRDIRQTGQFTV